jgi:predicted protein tyrosine phosphatase
MSIVVCPLSKVADMIGLHRPERVISMLDPELSFPDLGMSYADRHLRLSFHDINMPFQDMVPPSAEHIRAVLRFVDESKNGGPFLIHCHAGISRSTATAYVVACFANPDSDEHEIALRLRQASPLARPNERLVRLADREMRRKGRMSEAISITGQGLAWPDVREGEPFRMALKHS